MGRMLVSSSELVPSQEGADVAATVSHILVQANGKLSDALSLAKIHAKKHGMDVLTLQRAVAVQFTRSMSADLLDGQRERGAAFDVGTERAERKKAGYDSAREETFGAVFSKDELAARRAELAAQQRHENSIRVPFRVVHAHGRHS